MATYRIQDLYGKRIRVIKPVKSYRSFTNTSAPLKSYNAGDEIGELWSSYSDEFGNVWMIFYDYTNRPYYVKYFNGLLDGVTLAIQGVQTEQEILQTQEEAQETTLDKIGTWLMVAGAAFAGFLLLRDQLRK